MNIVTYFQGKLQFSLTTLILISCLTGVQAQFSYSVDIAQIPGTTTYTIGTNGLGTDDLVFYRFSDGFDMSAMKTSSNAKATVERRFKTGPIKVSAYIARKNGPVGFASNEMPIVSCATCALPWVGLGAGEVVRLRNTSWDAYIDP
jgi:hypothetical protein